MSKFQIVKGMRDILPKQQVYWQKVREVVKDLARSFGFQRLDTPVLEETALFIKGTGTTTDIVQKEMFSLTTKGRDKLSLRPEFTPAVVRAYLENGMTSWPRPVKLYSLGPLFRYDRPQKGRFREFFQANFEIIGEADPVLDAQLIQLFFAILEKLGLKKTLTQINSIGCPVCRPGFRKSLLSFYKNKRKELCADCIKRLQQNPLRVLDCKKPGCVEIAQQAPQIIDFLCDECRLHFKNVLEYLDELEISYILNPYLVRGLDYYTKTVFEVWPEGEEGRQSSLGGGGRYDGLVKLLGGRSTPAVGFAMGMDRVVDLMQAHEVKVVERTQPVIFLVQLGDLAKRKSLRLSDELRRAGLEVAFSFSRAAIKDQLRIADKLKVRFTLILGQKEVLDESIIIKDMQSGSQEVVPLVRAIKELKKRLKAK